MPKKKKTKTTKPKVGKREINAEKKKALAHAHNRMVSEERDMWVYSSPNDPLMFLCSHFELRQREDVLIEHVPYKNKARRKKTAETVTKSPKPRITKEAKPTTQTFDDILNW